MSQDGQKNLVESTMAAPLSDAAIPALQSALRSFVRRRVKTQAETDDLVQEAFARLYSARIVSAITEPQAYLFRIAANLISDHHRRANNPVVTVDPYDEKFAPIILPDQEARLRQDDLQRLFEQALAKLPDRQRQVFLMSRFEDKGTLAIALQLRISRRMVQKHLILAVSYLYNQLRPFMEGGQ